MICGHYDNVPGLGNTGASCSRGERHRGRKR